MATYNWSNACSSAVAPPRCASARGSRHCAASSTRPSCCKHRRRCPRLLGCRAQRAVDRRPVPACRARRRLALDPDRGAYSLADAIIARVRGRDPFAHPGWGGTPLLPGRDPVDVLGRGGPHRAVRCATVRSKARSAAPASCSGLSLSANQWPVPREHVGEIGGLIRVGHRLVRLRGSARPGAVGIDVTVLVQRRAATLDRAIGAVGQHVALVLELDDRTGRQGVVGVHPGGGAGTAGGRSHTACSAFEARSSAVAASKRRIAKRTSLGCTRRKNASNSSSPCEESHHVCRRTARSERLVTAGCL